MVGSGGVCSPVVCALRSGPLSSHGPEALLWLWDTVPVPAAGGALGLSLLPGPSKGNLLWLATPNTATVNMIPCIFQAGVLPAVGDVPLCCVVLLGQALCSYALTPRPNWGASTPTPARLWF